MMEARLSRDYPAPRTKEESNDLQLGKHRDFSFAHASVAAAAIENFEGLPDQMPTPINDVSKADQKRL